MVTYIWNFIHFHIFFNHNNRIPVNPADRLFHHGVGQGWVRISPVKEIDQARLSFQSFQQRRKFLFYDNAVCNWISKLSMKILPLYPLDHRKGDVLDRTITIDKSIED
jgi:hypothetical protein